MRSLIILVVLVAFQSGYGLRCYESQCNSFTGQCSKDRQEKTCGSNQFCMTQSTTQKGVHNATLVTTVQTCILKTECSEAAKSQRCSSVKNATKDVTHCNIECCDSDLCNGDKTPSKSPTTATTNATKVPSGADLTCYVCETSLPSNETSNTTSCDDPAKQQCSSPNDPAAKFMDRCMTTTSTTRHPRTGMIVELEARQCASSMSKQCSEICQTLNSTGTLLTCKSHCCIGSLCNTPQTTTTPAPPKGGQSESAMISLIAVGTGFLFALFAN